MQYVNLKPYYAIIIVSGKDALQFLQGILTADIREYKNHELNLSALCNSKGRIHTLFQIFKSENAFYLLFPKELLSSTLIELRKYARFSKVEIQEANSELAIYGIIFLPSEKFDINEINSSFDEFPMYYLKYFEELMIKNQDVSVQKVSMQGKSYSKLDCSTTEVSTQRKNDSKPSSSTSKVSAQKVSAKKEEVFKPDYLTNSEEINLNSGCLTGSEEIDFKPSYLTGSEKIDSCESSVQKKMKDDQHELAFRFLLIGPHQQVQNIIEHVKNVFLGKEDDFNLWKLLNIRSEIPEVWEETKEQFLPHNINLPALNAVSFNKGCYLGQEIIARMQYKGQIKRHLQRIIIADSKISLNRIEEIPLPGTLLIKNPTDNLLQLVDNSRFNAEVNAIGMVISVSINEYNELELLIEMQK